jgi:hypothetical protein
MTELADQVLEFIELRGHVTYDELERYGDDVYAVLDHLLAIKKVHRSLRGIISERQCRQNKLDEWWQAKLDEKAILREAQEKRSFHRAPGDPDWPSGGDTSVDR